MCCFLQCRKPLHTDFWLLNLKHANFAKEIFGNKKPGLKIISNQLPYYQLYHEIHQNSLKYNLFSIFKAKDYQT